MFTNDVYPLQGSHWTAFRDMTHKTYLVDLSVAPLYAWRMFTLVAVYPLFLQCGQFWTGNCSWLHRSWSVNPPLATGRVRNVTVAEAVKSFSRELQERGSVCLSTVQRLNTNLFICKMIHKKRLTKEGKGWKGGITLGGTLFHLT